MTADAGDATEGTAVPDAAPMLRERRDGAVLVLTLDQPARRNALAMPMRRSLIAALERAEADRGLRAVVLTGGGGQFSAGGDVAGMTVADVTEGRARMALSHHLVRLMAKGGKPLVAAVEGWCVGAGLSLACCCDSVFAAEDSRFMAGFARIGLIPDLGLLHTLPARVGQGPARRLMMGNGPMPAAEAERIGLVDRLVPPGTALDAALAAAHAMAEAAPLSLALTRQYLGAGLDAALDWEREVQSGLFMTADFAEGRAAFLEKRAPRFRGA